MLNVIGPINQTSYGLVTLNVLKELTKLTDVALFPVGGYYSNENREFVKPLVDNADFYDPASPCLILWHETDLASHVGNGLQTGYSFFEINPIKARAVHHINQLDRFCVASEWGRGVVVQSGVSTPTYVVPLGVDRTIFNEGVPAEKSPDRTVFFNAGKLELRKGHQFLLECFNKAFEPSDPVTLVLLNHNGFLGDANYEWFKTCKGSKMGQNIEVLPRVATQQQLASIMRSADCGVFPSRAEGWNLELLECMAVGIQTIATDYSAHTEFANDLNCLLIDIDETEPAVDGLWFFGEGNWACLRQKQEEQLINHMRAIHRLKMTGKLPLNRAGIVTSEKFSWSNSASKLMELLNA